MELATRLVTASKADYLPLLRLADESDDLIAGYLDRGDLFVVEEAGTPVAVCVVTDEGGGTYEVQNLAVAPSLQRRGLGSSLLRHVEDHYRGRATSLVVGTGDSPLTVPFYEACGFRVYRRIRRGVADAYDHPIYEAGVQLIDKVYLRRKVASPKRAESRPRTVGNPE